MATADAAWRVLRRVASLILVLAGATAVFLDLSGRMDTHVFERVVVFLLALIAIDSLIERLGLLEKIDAKVDQYARVSSGVGLRDRSRINVEQLFSGARQIDIAGVTLLNILNDRQLMFRKLLEDGARLRVLVLNPDSSDWKAWTEAWTEESIHEPTLAQLETTKSNLRKLQAVRNGSCEIKFAPYLLPSALVIVNGSLPSGRLVAEMLFPAIDGAERPHVMVHREHDPEWFEFFRGRFEAVWRAADDAVP